ncbi:DUF4354 family protein [Pantoea sp. ACRSB]|uniref:DUF4354 family protein n=1 Tax=Pantoea sp. ACRSB TaxID=2918207 RepID=UPI0028932973|nr:DUF4354 family protein [Pantoea sp. ACRSB]MCG7386974.1 DUF4354 family protein [Pantoea sp. ACRSB]
MLKSTKAMLLSLTMLAAGSCIASESTPDLTVFASKDAQGSVWNSRTDQPEYQVSYKVTINNMSKEAYTPSEGKKMCFFLFNNQGRQIKNYGIQYELYAPYKGGESRNGIVIFASHDASLFDLPFVKLGLGDTCLTAVAKP